MALWSSSTVLHHRRQLNTSRSVSQVSCPTALVSFAREVFSASRYVMNHPPPWCPPVTEGSGRGAPFHFFEVLEQRVTWAAYSFLQSRVGLTSAIWLHDGFWITPRPEEELLSALHSHLCQTFGYDLTETPLMRCDPLQPISVPTCSRSAQTHLRLSARSPEFLPAGHSPLQCDSIENAFSP